MRKPNDLFSARLKTAKTALDLRGIFADHSRPYDSKEREKAWAAVSKEVLRKGRQ